MALIDLLYTGMPQKDWEEVRTERKLPSWSRCGKGEGPLLGERQKVHLDASPHGKKKHLELLRDRQQILPHPGHRSRLTVAWKTENGKGKNSLHLGRGRKSPGPRP